MTVSTLIPIDLGLAWRNIQTPALLQFVTKGIIRFRSNVGEFPKKWEQGKTYGAKMRVFGFIPFGGTHYLYMEKIDHANHIVKTKEWDNSARIWNHQVVMRKQSVDVIYDEDQIDIYAGALTGFIILFARFFYQHRQRRWQKVAQAQMDFTQ